MKEYRMLSALSTIFVYLILIEPGNSSNMSSTTESPKMISEILEMAYDNNPAIQAESANAQAEESLLASTVTPDSPMVGISTLKRGTTTRYGTISQRIEFPAKYYVKGKAQSSRARSAQSSLENIKLQVRQNVISTYFAIYSVEKIILLTRSNIRAVREFARVAEHKYAAGTTPQSDSMKAHLEITQLELDLIRLKQRKESLLAHLRFLVGDEHLEVGDLGKIQYQTPQFDESRIDKLTQVALQQSPLIQREREKLNEVEWKNALTKWEFAPDIELRYQQQIAGLPSDSNIYSVGLTLPLWFWGKTSKSSAAKFKVLSQKHRLRKQKLETHSKVNELKTKVTAGQKSLKVFETSLLPQAQGAYNSTRSAYKATGKGFLNLLDSERTLYRVKTSFYQTYSQYISSFTELEVYLGQKISDIESLKGTRK